MQIISISGGISCMKIPAGDFISLESQAEVIKKIIANYIENLKITIEEVH